MWGTCPSHTVVAIEEEAQHKEGFLVQDPPKICDYQSGTVVVLCVCVRECACTASMTVCTHTHTRQGSVFLCCRAQPGAVGQET